MRWREYLSILMYASPGEFRPIVVAPTFDNARTLECVVRQVLDLGLPLIVVNDGCRDQSATILTRLAATFERLIVITHQSNQGKAAALLAGFRRASDMRFSHAVTIDTDGQLDAAEIADLLEASGRHPNALVVGRRDAAAADYPSASRTGRFVSNYLVRLESGARVADSQCGFRVYPLRQTLTLRCRASRYGLETEVLTRAAWAGVPIVEVPVTCRYDVPEGRVTHFRKWRDSLAASWLHLRLLARAVAPWPVRRFDADDCPTGTPWARFYRWINPVTAWRTICNDAHDRSRFAAGLAAGVFVANLPLYGVQTLLSLLLARRFRLHPVPVVVGSHLSTPPVGPLLIALAMAVGHWMLHGTPPTWGAYNPAVHGYLATLRGAFIEWTVGGVACGTALAGLTFLIAHLVLRQLPVRTREAPTVRPMAQVPTLGLEAEESVA